MMEKPLITTVDRRFAEWHLPFINKLHDEGASERILIWVEESVRMAQSAAESCDLERFLFHYVNLHGALTELGISLPTRPITLLHSWADFTDMARGKLADALVSNCGCRDVKAKSGEIEEQAGLK